MNAIILAAGLGKRLHPLTKTIPKPLISVKGKAALSYHLDKLIPIVESIYINTFWLSHKIEDYINQYYPNNTICLVQEKKAPLETGGGIANILAKYPQSDKILIINADIYTDFDFKHLISIKEDNNHLAHLILVKNPKNKNYGDFSLNKQMINNEKLSKNQYTFSGISIISPQIFKDYSHLITSKIFSITPLLKQASIDKKVSGELYRGKWFDIGCKETLAQLNKTP